MTRLATVLARALHDHNLTRFGGCPTGNRREHDAAHEAHADHLVAAIPEAQREALEVALDRCTYPDCGLRLDWYGHHSRGPLCEPHHHPYQPLVPLGDPS